MGKVRIRVRIAGRVLAATLGAYGFTAGTAALIAAVLVAVAHLSRSDAMIVGSILAYLIFTVLMLWCFAERRLGRIWFILLLGVVATHGTAILVERTLPVSGAPA